jgi:hypothetical protein
MAPTEYLVAASEWAVRPFVADRLGWRRRAKGIKGKTISLDVTVSEGRLEDMLLLGVRQKAVNDRSHSLSHQAGDPSATSRFLGSSSSTDSKSAPPTFRS